MDVRFCGEQEPQAERQYCATADPDQMNCALSRARLEILRFSLDTGPTWMPVNRPQPGSFDPFAAVNERIGRRNVKVFPQSAQRPR
jgi:hypothetical protein